MEHDEAARKLGRTILEESGYAVLEAKDGQEALNIYRERNGANRIVIADVITPKMNGQDLCREVRKIHPAVKVLFKSGYAQDLLINTGVLESGLPFLSKPASKDSLLTMVHAMLDNKE